MKELVEEGVDQGFNFKYKDKGFCHWLGNQEENSHKPTVKESTGERRQ